MRYPSGLHRTGRGGSRSARPQTSRCRGSSVRARRNILTCSRREPLAAADMRRVVAAALTGEARPDAAPKADEAAEGTTGYRRHRVEGAGTAADVAIPAVPYRTGGPGLLRRQDGTHLLYARLGHTAPGVVDGRCPDSDQPIVIYAEGRVPENRDAARVPSRARAAIAVHPLRPVIRAAVISNVLTTPVLACETNILARCRGMWVSASAFARRPGSPSTDHKERRSGDRSQRVRATVTDVVDTT